MKITAATLTATLAAALLLGLLGAPGQMEESVLAQQQSAPTYHSPDAVVVSPDGKRVYVADNTASLVTVLDTQRRTVEKEIAVHGQPRALCLTPDGQRLFVAERLGGTVALIDTDRLAVTGRVQVGRWPVCLGLAPKSGRLFVGNQDRHTVSVVQLQADGGKVIKELPAVREPSCIAVTPDEKFVVVTNLLPLGAATDPTLGAVVNIYDGRKLELSATVQLPPGSTVVRGVCTSPDGRWAYVVHGLGRFNLPITQLERGWVNTYALSVLDVPKGTRLVTMLLDDLTQGAANPHSVVCSADGQRLWISHSGVHEVSIVEIGKVHQLLEGNVPADLAALKDGMQPNIWVRIQQDRSVMSELENDLTALYIAGAIHRAPTGGRGPQGLALAPNGQTLYVANYYSGTVGVLDAADGQLEGTITVGSQPEPDSRRRGEALFHDATISFQRWHSCATCHPNQGRVDGLRWDFLRDGIGNGKDTPSLVYFYKTLPLNRRGTRKTAREGVQTGLTAGHMIVPTQQQVDDVLAYLTSLRPEPSPHLNPDGSLTEAAQRGKRIFEGKADCAHCHPAPLFTDKKMHNVGVLSPNEPDGRYDTPSLLEAYRTQPYLHDGRARTIREVLTRFNQHGRHGKTRRLTEQELDDLVAYILSL